jgi:hypothetical protein
VIEEDAPRLVPRSSRPDEHDCHFNAHPRAGDESMFSDAQERQRLRMSSLMYEVRSRYKRAE